ncbi:UNVERIFIED_CONTAM: hypothetical protein GTU68_040862, partial [Idotea baltica]|nr:hypothetical protein [Idotea baltica]
GQGRRFGGQDKGLIQLKGQSLVLRIVQQVLPQTQHIVINANRNSDAYRALGFPIIGDTLPDFQGPLSGIASVMAQVDAEFILTLPCDAPLVPDNYVSTMVNRQQETGAEIVVASDGERLQPVYALIATKLLPKLLSFLARGERKIDHWYSEHLMVTQDFSAMPEVFHNLNTDAQKQAFEAGLTSMPTQAAAIQYSLPLLGFAAYSGTGKTTLLKQLLPKLREKGLRVGVVKHAHHTLEVDHPGKDSYEIRKAGAEQMLVVSRSQVAWIQDIKDEGREPSLQESLSMLKPDGLDLVLVEGFKRESFPKIELHREVINKRLMYPEDKDIIAFSSEERPSNCPIPWLDLNDVDGIVNFIIERYQDVK